MNTATKIDNRFIVSDSYDGKTYVTASFRRYFPLAFDYFKKTGQAIVKANRCVFDFSESGNVRFFSSEKSYQNSAIKGGCDGFYQFEVC